MEQVINAINNLKSSFHGQDLTDVNILSKVREHILQDPRFDGVNAAKQLVTDLQNCIDKNIATRLVHTKIHINTRADNLVFSLFSAPYSPELSIDGFFYQEVDVPLALKEKLRSPTCPVKMIRASEGFSSDTVVALFPENHIDGIQLPEDRIFYFIDKFVTRFFKVTKPLLDLIVSGQFSKLRQANVSEIEYASSCWVHWHEYFHRQGAMPISGYLDVKGSKATAGLEELRVDILSILACVENPNFFPDAYFVAEFVFMERLMRYGVESPDNLTYDAISSQFLFKYLVSHEGITIDSHFQISVNPKIFLLLKKLSSEIAALESEIETSDRGDVKLRLKHFVSEYVDCDNTRKKFVYSEYFKWMRPGFLLANNLI
jgi:hypothetical protein